MNEDQKFVAKMLAIDLQLLQYKLQQRLFGFAGLILASGIAIGFGVLQGASFLLVLIAMNLVVLGMTRLVPRLLPAARRRVQRLDGDLRAFALEATHGFFQNESKVTVAPGKGWVAVSGDGDIIVFRFGSAGKANGIATIIYGERGVAYTMTKLEPVLEWYREARKHLSQQASPAEA